MDTSISIGINIGMNLRLVSALQTIAAYLPCFGQAIDKLQGKVVTHLKKLNGGEF